MKHMYGVIIFLTGCCSLIYQVIWQRYLHLFVGSEMRSTTIIVAIFLAGLSLGYILFGRLSLRFSDRRSFLKFYGYVEIATGAYAIFFPQLFAWLDASPLTHQASLLSDFLIGAILLLPPTILMGATIPVMTTVLPTQNAGVNRGHALIYGLNTLGAFVGVLLASFVLIVHFGLLLSLMISGIVNVLCGMVYVGNRLQGNIRKVDEMPQIASNYTASDVYVLAFVSGLVSISLEMIWMRLLALTIGSSFIIFPMILSLFVLGLGIGSLTVKTVTPARLRRQFYLIMGGLILSFLAVPYLPLWISNLRVTLDNQPINYYLFHAAIYLIMGIMITSFLIPMGKLLPMSYAFLAKDSEQYGFKCGFLYFVNTAGTFLGTVFLSYLCLYLLSIETIYKINIAIVMLAAIWMALKDRRYLTTAVVGAMLIAMTFGMTWNRMFHVFGLYMARTPSPYNLRGAWNLTPAGDDANLAVPYFKDGPDATVGVLHGRRQYPGGETTDFKAIVINGKSDSSTLGDYTTLSLAAFLPYVYASKASGLTTAVVGQGTGVTAGILSQFQDVAQVDLIEISPAVVASLPHFSDFTYGLEKSSKLNIQQVDAFKHFRRHHKPYDIIVSEPTNPWVVGVENLFTPYFYNLAKSNLSHGGILAQWMHTSLSDRAILNTIWV